MTEYGGLNRLVERAVVTAIDDGTEGTLNQIRFDVDHLAHVIRATTTPDRLNAAAASCEEQMIRWIKESVEDPALFAHARAALALKNKLTSPRGRTYREGPDGSLIPLD